MTPQAVASGATNLQGRKWSTRAGTRVLPKHTPVSLGLRLSVSSAARGEQTFLQMSSLFRILCRAKKGRLGGTETV